MTGSTRAKHYKTDTIEGMGCNSLGWARHATGEERRNVCALVIYIPDPLGRFLDELRREMVPAYNPHAHVSVLPPRPMVMDWQNLAEQARSVTEAYQPFDVELTTVQLFPATDVVYLEVGGGAAELKQLHLAMNTGALAFDEPFAYHPHITLAQDLPPDQVSAARELADRRWREFPGDRWFRAERVVLVQNTLADDCWIDLAEYTFGSKVPTSAKF
jgi:2'-5' RNA ligase